MWSRVAKQGLRRFKSAYTKKANTTVESKAKKSTIRLLSISGHHTQNKNRNT